jgi:hypothetical protein
MHREKSGFMEPGNYISASNFIIKRSLLKSYGGFNPDLGMKGDKIKYGEEVEIVRRALNEDRKVYYSHDLKVDHLVPEFKMHIGYCMYRLFSSGKNSASIDELETTFDNLQKYPSLVDQTLSDIEKSFVIDDVEEYDYPENFLVEEVFPTLHTIGRLTHSLRENFNPNILSYIQYLEVSRSSLSLRDYLTALLRLTKILINALRKKIKSRLENFFSK